MIKAIRRLAPISAAVLFGVGVAGIALADGAPATASAPATTSATAAAKPAPKMEKKVDAKKAKREAFVAFVKRAQTALNADGAKLKVNGYLDKETRAAIKAFQKKNGLKETGHLNKATRAKLKV